MAVRGNAQNLSKQEGSPCPPVLEAAIVSCQRDDGIDKDAVVLVNEIESEEKSFRSRFALSRLVVEYSYVIKRLSLLRIVTALKYDCPIGRWRAIKA